MMVVFCDFFLAVGNEGSVGLTREGQKVGLVEDTSLRLGACVSRPVHVTVLLLFPPMLRY